MRIVIADDEAFQIVTDHSECSHFIDAESIDYLESERNRVSLYVGDERYRARGTLKHFVAVLAPLGFVRIERSVLINLRKVAFAQRLDRGAFAFTLQCGRRMISSSKYRKDILEEIRRVQFAGAANGH